MQIVEQLFVNQLTDDDRRMIALLEERAKAANAFFRKKNDVDPVKARDTSIDDCVNQLISLLEEFLQQPFSGEE